MGLTVLDASVLIGVLHSGDAHHRASRAALTAAVDRGDELIVPAAGYLEVLVGPLRRVGLQGRGVIDEFLAALPASIAPVTAEIAAAAAALRAVHLRLRTPDALILATALTRRADRVLTADARWPSIPGVHVELVGDGGVLCEQEPAYAAT